MTTYYDRDAITHIDGSPVFRSPSDEAAENIAASALAALWHCEIRPFGVLSPIDYYCVRHGRVVGLLEVKARSHTAETYPTVFLNARKYLALLLGATAFGVPAVFAVLFADGELRWVPIGEIDASAMRVGGCARKVKAQSDVEPVIEVPVVVLRPAVAGPAQRNPDEQLAGGQHGAA